MAVIFNKPTEVQSTPYAGSVEDGVLKYQFKSATKQKDGTYKVQTISFSIFVQLEGDEIPETVVFTDTTHLAKINKITILSDGKPTGVVFECRKSSESTK